LVILEVMFEVRRTDAFIDWLKEMRDLGARVRIAKRIDRLAFGNFGVYYTLKAEVVVILLCGGDKNSQSRDIEKAKKMAQEI
jgi:putative component of toxin-antitoxin plasmid stabilization module